MNASGDTSGNAEEQDPFLDGLANLWIEARDTIDSFANSYLSGAAEENKLSGPDWLSKNVDLASRMWVLWLESTSLFVDRGLQTAKTQQRKASGR